MELNIATAEEKAQKLKRRLQVGDWVMLLGEFYQWEAEDYLNDYGEDLKEIHLWATHMYKNGWSFDILSSTTNTLKKTVNDIVLKWDWKTRELTYFRDNFMGGFDKIDTVDKLQRGFRLIGLEDEANNFDPHDLEK